MKKRLLIPLLLAPAFSFAGEFSVTILPHASISYRADGKVIPQSYFDDFDGNSAPLYRLDWREDRAEKGYWGVALVHTGVFGGGKYARETVPDVAGGTYQTNLMNVGFTNVHLTRRQPLAAIPSVEWLLEFTIAREIWKRSDFNVQGVPSGIDDVNELSSEGIGFGLEGRHGGRAYARWALAASHMVQIFDARTDASAGQIFRYEAALGLELGRGCSVEAGGLYQYWFMLGQGDRRLEVPGTAGAVISWNRQDTRASGFFLSLRQKFSSQ